jgi:type II secretory pathway pseudopilin PulG
MVEMLGVLAIIGVLSVGAIAGYSKAMMKYKLNKHAEQMNTLINAVARNVHSFDNIKQIGTSLAPYLIKMGEVPTEMIKQNQTNLIYDIFGQAWEVFIGDFDGKTIFLSSYSTDGSSSLTIKSADNLEICKNILITAKENSGNIYSVYTVSNHHTDDKEQALLVGDSLCTSRRKCLKNLTLNDIYEICTKHYGINSVSGTELAITWNR